MYPDNGASKKAIQNSKEEPQPTAESQPIEESQTTVESQPTEVLYAVLNSY